jgi:hypothetical protein
MAIQFSNVTINIFGLQGTVYGREGRETCFALIAGAS